MAGQPLVVGFEGGDVLRAAGAVADAVGEQGDVGDAEVVQQRPGQFNDFGVNGGVGVADGFHAELVVLPEAPGLGAFVAEDGAEVVHPHGLGAVVHPVLQVGAADGGGAFGAQGEQVAAPVLKDIHFLFYDVGAFADAANKEAGVLKNGAVDAPVAEAAGDADGSGFDVAPVFLLWRQAVGSASGGLEGGHSGWRLRGRLGVVVGFAGQDGGDFPFHTGAFRIAGLLNPGIAPGSVFSVGGENHFGP